MAATPATNDPRAAKAASPTPARSSLSPARIRLGLGLTGLVLLGGLAAWWLTRPTLHSPAKQVEQALKLLESGKHAPAREIAKRLTEQGYRHPGCAGVLDYIQGVATFELVEAAGELGDRSQYSVAAAFLRKADDLALEREYRPRWSYALGKSYYMVQDGTAARPLLEEVLGLVEGFPGFPPGRIDASEMLVDLYLYPGVRTPELLNRALELNDDVLQAEPQDRRKTDIALLQRAEIFLSTQDFQLARDVLAKLSKSAANSQVSQLLQARILLAEERYEEALERLRPIAMNDRLGQSHAAEACFLLGLTAEHLAELSLTRGDSLDNPEAVSRRYTSEAISFFKQTADRFDRTPEATAANLHLGRLWRLSKVEQKALQAYGSALMAFRPLPNPESFRNRWVSLEQFRQAILEAWNAWVQSQQYSESIALAEMMTPLFPREEAYEFAARVHQRWAEAIEEELADKKFSDRQTGTENLRRRWRQSAEAFVRLAGVRVSSSKYPEALWNAADQFRRGYDFERALDLINQFLATEPDRLMAAALVQRSRIELDLDRIPEALADLQQVVRTYPTDPAAFSALYLIGVCHFELDQLAEAEAAWRGILTSEQLSPSAVEWRDAQLSLGQLLFEKGDLKRRDILRRSSPPEPADLIKTYREASRSWQEASRLLSRYLDRNQSGAGVIEARYFLAKALQRDAEWLARQLQIAETDNARQQLETQRDAALQKSLRHFEILRDELLAGQNSDQIDELQQRMLRNCFFEVPHLWFELREYDRAISAYNAAINKYPQDVQTLVAYVQMSQCHLQQEPPRKVEARNMLQQAKLLLSHKQIPHENFQLPSSNFSPAEWQHWLERARQVE